MKNICIIANFEKNLPFFHQFWMVLIKKRFFWIVVNKKQKNYLSQKFKKSNIFVFT